MSIDAGYTPLAGSLADRVIKHLQTLPEGAELSSMEVSMALNCLSASLQASCESAVQNGFLKRRLNHTPRLTYWSLGHRAQKGQPMGFKEESSVRELEKAIAENEQRGKGTPAPSYADIPTLTAPSQAVVTPVCLPPVLTEPEAEALRPDPTPDEGEPSAEEPEEPAFGCALFEDGRLFLELGGDAMTLQAHHLARLYKFLNRAAPAVAEILDLQQ